ncbi:MAG: aminotransferase class V-fold PLP-dependent enzyme [Planctomycetes bacterium]|nr:aminotransferase class V-fold PLP-dependent enzyme [Planctomycetota bacterium]
MIYLDHAATAFARPPEVRDAMVHFLDRVSANPGRSGHRLSLAAAEVVYEAREAVAELFHAPDPLRVVFGLNGTEAINQALVGLLRPGDHVVTSSLEHNAVMRPLRALEARGVAVTVVRCSPEGLLDPAHIEQALRPETRMIVLNHASNVVGTVLPVAAAGRIARAHGVLLLVDAAQTAGAWPIDVEGDHIDLLAFTGHKSLLGPTGTGGLVIGARVDPGAMQPLKHGGTGSASEHERQPEFLPDRLESGTPNAVGIAGLGAAVRWLLDRGIEAVQEQEAALAVRLIAGLSAIAGVRVYGTEDPARRTATVSFTVAGRSVAEVGYALDESFDILSRVGLHCAPAAHRTIGTFPEGTVRFSLGLFNNADDVDCAVDAVARIAGGSP